MVQPAAIQAQAAGCGRQIKMVFSFETPAFSVPGFSFDKGTAII